MLSGINYRLVLEYRLGPLPQRGRRGSFPLLNDNFVQQSKHRQRLLPVLTYLLLSSQKATALAAATFRESTPWYMGIFTV